jgi:hypothetical protein
VYLTGACNRKLKEGTKQVQAYLIPGPGENQPGQLDVAGSELRDSVAVRVDGGGQESHRINLVEIRL